MDYKDLYDKQNEKAKNHNLYRHYTNLESVIHILSDRKLRLSQLKKLNDPIEEGRISEKSKIYSNKVFVSCFTNKFEELIPMWKMYTTDKMGVCLIFDDLKFLEDKANYSGLSNGWEVKEARLFDIYYDDNLEKLEHKDDIFGDNSYYQCNSQGLGFSKTCDWDFEYETRIRCYIDVAPGNLSRPLNPITREFGIKYPDFDYIFCNIPDVIINSLKIIYNPFMNDTLKKIVKEKVREYIPNIDDDAFINSNLEGKIKP